MNNTPRLLNRVYLMFAGLVLAVIGLAYLAYRFIPAVQPEWAEIAGKLRQLNQEAYIGNFMLPANWMWAVVIAMLGLAAVSAILMLRWQTAGRATHFAKLMPVTGSAATAGSITLHTKVAEQLLKEHLEDDVRVLNVSVNAHRVGTANALKARVDMRRGAELSAVTEACQRAAEQFTELFGAQIPMVFEIKTGARGALTGSQRVL